MNWGFSTALFALWLVPLVGFLVIRAHLKRRDAATRFVDPVMGQRLMPSFELGRTWFKAILLMAAAAMLIVAVARPRFGVEWEDVSARGVDLAH